MPLTDATIRKTKPRERIFKLHDEKGLYLEITPKGAKRWRFKYRRPGTGKENRLSMGVYPEVTLKEARRRRDEARKLLDVGIDPGQARRAEQVERRLAAANSFQAVAEEWIAEHLATKSKSYREKIARLLSRDVFPYLTSSLRFARGVFVSRELHRIECGLDPRDSYPGLWPFRTTWTVLGVRCAGSLLFWSGLRFELPFRN